MVVCVEGVLLGSSVFFDGARPAFPAGLLPLSLRQRQRASGRARCQRPGLEAASPHLALFSSARQSRASWQAAATSERELPAQVSRMSQGSQAKCCGEQSRASRRCRGPGGQSDCCRQPWRQHRPPVTCRDAFKSRRAAGLLSCPAVSQTSRAHAQSLHDTSRRIPLLYLIAVPPPGVPCRARRRRRSRSISPKSVAARWELIGSLMSPAAQRSQPPSIRPQ